MAYIYKFLILSFLSTLRHCSSEVNLKIILQPPIATLECTITHILDESSVILMCPNELMCFQNCDRLCSNETCIGNDISCAFATFGSAKRFTYVFNSSNPRNHGEWTCHYGSMKGSTVTFYSSTPNIYTKRDVPSILTGIQPKQPAQIQTSIEPVVTRSSTTPHTIIVNPDGQFNISNINPYYVVILLVVLSISLLINILFLVRDMLTNISARKALLSDHNKNYSCWLALCIKFFCLKKFLDMKLMNRGQTRLNENNPLISRQVSSNIYEHPAAFHIQTPFLLENFAYAATPANERIPFQNSFMRSKSFPVKNNDSTLYPSNFGTVKVVPDKNTPLNHEESASTNELTNQIIYDDVAEPSLHHIPYDGSNFYSSLVRQNQRPTRHISMQHKTPLGARSLSNLNLISKYPSDTMMSGNVLEGDNESILKGAINSRVELSKEMITQADNLLKQADSLLNKRDVEK